ncbi:MAG: hypothetical protein Q8Q28_06285 [Pseudomonadota bacterium]|nr:hypothetical protein [Pseudomonadota bacterium]
MKVIADFPRSTALLGMVCCLSTGTASATGEWTSTLGAQGIYGSYSGALQRDSLTGYGLVFSSDYLERGGFSLGLNHSDVKAQAGVANTKQNALFASGRIHSTPDSLPGRLTWRLDLHAIDNDDATRNSDEVTAIAPQVSYLSFDKRRYFDLGYARSSYQNDLSVNQWTPTLGFGLNDGADWLQLRGWFIDPSNTARAQGKGSTSAVEMKWTHWLGANRAGIDNVKASLVAGERIYAVDGDAGSVANLSDIHRGGASLGAEWKLGKAASLLALIGQDRFRNASLTPVDDYTLNYAYLWLSSRW